QGCGVGLVHRDALRRLWVDWLDISDVEPLLGLAHLDWHPASFSRKTEHLDVRGEVDTVSGSHHSAPGLARVVWVFFSDRGRSLAHRRLDAQRPDQLQRPIS